MRRTGIRSVQIPVYYRSMLPVLLIKGPVQYRSDTGPLFKKRSSTVPFKKDQYWSGIDRERPVIYRSLSLVFVPTRSYRSILVKKTTERDRPTMTGAANGPERE